MRTRFLDTDYFSASLTSEALKDFEALSLPTPNLCSPDPFLTVENTFLVPDAFVQHEIDMFPFEEALTDFLSDVIPRFLGVGDRRSSDGSAGIQFAPSCGSDRVEIGSEVSRMEYTESEDGSFYKEMEVKKSSEYNSGASVAKLPETFLQFEIPEVEEFSMWEMGIAFKEKKATLFFEVPGVGVPLDNIDVEMEISITGSYEVDRLLCLIEDVPDILIISQESFSAEGGNSLQDSSKLCHAIKLPSFEVGESVLGAHEIVSMDKTFNDLLTYLKPRKNGDELVVNAKDFLGCTNDNFSEYFSTQDISEYGLEHKPMALNSLLEVDLINLNGCVLLEKQSVIYPVVSDEFSPHFPCSAQLEEVQIFDRITVNVPDMFSSFETPEKEGLFEQMYKEEIGHMENFYESVLTSELSLTDDAFKLLPAPILNDDKTLKSVSMILEDIFSALKPHSFSVCDEIYLDWHPLLDGTCNNETCSTFKSMMQEVSSYMIDIPEFKHQYEPFISSDFDFLDDSSGELSISQHKELSYAHENCPDAVVPEVDTPVTEIVNQDLKKSEGAEQMPKRNPAKISSLFESLSQSNDLNFFLGVRKGSTEVSTCFETSTENRPSGRITSGNTLKEPSEAAAFSELNIEKIDVHKVSLSGYTLSLIDLIQGIYFSNLNKCKHLITNSSLSTTTELLSIPKGRLLELISEKGGSQCALGTRDEAFIALLAIYAIKQLVYYLCFFGINIAYLYVSICSDKVDSLAERLQPLQSLLQDAHGKVEKQIIDSHPSLPLIEGLLRSNASKGSKKTLIISNEVFWPSLKNRLTILKISFHEVKHPYCPAEDILDKFISPNSILEALSHSDCLLLSRENTLASFPFSMFSNILEYGGPCATSRIPELFTYIGTFPQVHFIKFDMENHYLAKALCEGFDASKNPMISTEGFPRYMIYLQGCINDQNTEGLFPKFPLDKFCNHSCESVSTIEASHDDEYAKNMLFLSSSKKTTAKASSVPEVVIIVNTQNFDKNMIISRRSSYQKILELEKRGAQVVERDINLPLDLIFSAAACLVWYAARNIVDKTEAVVNISAVPAFIENIATKVLMSLSSSFNGCILIFEGESNFLASIMESSDMLYAAAASLDLNLQLFCSHMPETTDDIILNCIRTTSIKDRCLYSAMTESESIAESFLTSFPSLNPISAHAILSSGGMLIEFLEWSNERRIQAIGKYKVPAESLSLFNALCRYGELGESKSVMTDCSSIDSGNSGGSLQSKRKKQRYAMSQLNRSSSGMPESSQPYQSKNLRFHDVPEKTQFFSNGEIMDRKREVNYSKMSNLDGFHDDVIDYNYSFFDDPCASISRNRRSADLRCEPVSDRFYSSSRLSDGHTDAEINCSENDLTNFSKKICLEKESCWPKSGLFKKEMLIKRNNLHKNPYIGEFIRSNANQQLSQQQQQQQQQHRQKSIIESLGQANERSRMHQQSSCQTYVNCPGSLKRKGTYQKKSPSIIDSFRYQGGNKQVKGTVNRRRNLSRAQPSSRDLDKKDSALIIPTWTPIDKRARQNLSFTRTGNEQQSRLVWRRNDSPRVGCSMRKRQRDNV